MSPWVFWVQFFWWPIPLCYTKSTFLKNCNCSLLSDMQHLETETSWETIVMFITLWFSRSKMQSHILNSTDNGAHAIHIYISQAVWAISLSHFRLFLSKPSLWEKDAECHRCTFSHISKHKFHHHILLSHLALYFLRKAGTISKSWCLERPSGHLSHSLLFFSFLSHTFWLKPRHFKEALSVIALPNFIK